MKIWIIDLYNCDLVMIKRKLKVQFKLSLLKHIGRKNMYIHVVLIFWKPKPKCNILRYNHLTVLSVLLLSESIQFERVVSGLIHAKRTIGVRHI